MPRHSKQLRFSFSELPREMQIGDCCEKCVFYNGIEIEGRCCFHRIERPRGSVCQDYLNVVE